jgi:hypothetical protein
MGSFPPAQLLLPPGFQPIALLAPGIEPELEPQPDGDYLEAEPEVVEQPIPEPADLSSLTPFELRQRCQRSGIQWRNAHGKNKHLKKHEMIAAIRSNSLDEVITS